MNAEQTNTGTLKSGGQIIDVSAIKRDFPILNRKINDKRLVYLDSAATTQKPQVVIDAVTNYYTNMNANVHRGLHTLAEEATGAYESTRDRVAKFIGGVKREEIVFTRSATESINLVANSWGYDNINEGDRIVITQMEHHANLVPWLKLVEATGAELKYIPIDPNGYLNMNDLGDIINNKTKLVALTHMSNVLGTINPVEDIIDLAHQKGALALVDGAQAVPHMPVNVRDINADFYAFSAHKMLGPTGVGILYAKEVLFEEMEPFNLGGEMISEVRYDYVNWAELPHKFEAGTPNIAGVAAFSPAIEYLNKIGMDKIREHEIELTGYAIERLSELDHLRIYGPRDPHARGGAISVYDDQIHPHDLAQFLDSEGIAVRAGHHCAQPLTKLLGVYSTARASLYIYNDYNDIDDLVEALKEARRYFGL